MGDRKGSASFKNVQLKPYASTELKDPDVDYLVKNPPLVVAMKNGERKNIVVATIVVNDAGLTLTVHNMGPTRCRFDLEIG